MLTSGSWMLTILIVAGSSPADEPLDPQSLHHGAAFVRELDQPLSITREKVGVREVLERLARERRIAIVLDRRIDPGRTVDARLPPMTLRGALEAIASQADAVIRVVGDTVVVGPKDNIGLLRTICVMRGLELDAFGDALGGRQFQLARTYTLAWDDLERPADFVQTMAERAKLEVAGLDLVPHDLWARGVVAEMTATEALSWVLAQYDLTFAWTGTASGVQIIPLSGPVAVVREHAVRGIAADDALRRVQMRFPELEARLDGRVLVATGLIEQHDDIAALARGENPDAPARVVKLGSLAKLRLSLRLVSQPAAAAFKTLQDNGIDLRVDEPALAAAGVDLNRKINLEVTQATIQQLMEAICDPLGTSYAVTGETVYVPAP